ncbi:MAG: class II aldolase/adducin family protein [Conexivisphaerales archaeon]|nr:class II aldolase/adducin family protein [Conexivisphaerales archaeon]
MDDQLGELREQVARFMRLLYERHLVTPTGGNVSVRAGERSMLITASGVMKGWTTPDQVVLVDLQGRQLEQGPRPSSEWRVHARLYSGFPEVQSVVHAHPTFALSILGDGEASMSLVTEEALSLLPGGVRVLGKVKPGTPELAEAVAKAMVPGAAVLVKDHGAFAVGKSLLEAYSRMEVLEQSAQILTYKRLMEKSRHSSGLTPGD